MSLEIMLDIIFHVELRVKLASLHRRSFPQYNKLY